MKQNPYKAGSTLAVENSRFLSVASILPQDPAFTGIFYWRRGRDCSRLRRSSSASLRTAAAALRRPKSPSAILSNPLFYISGSNPRFVAVATEGSKTTKIYGNYGGEGGIRTLDGLLTHTPLAGARLRPLGHLSGWDIGPFAERGMIPVRSSPGKANELNASAEGHQASSTILATGAAPVLAS